MMKQKIRAFKNWVTNILSYVQLIPILPKINRGDIVIDCGANVGVVSGYFASKGARIYAFEPDPRAFAALSKRFEGNEMITCINKGVWIENTTMKLYQHADLTEDDLSFTVGSSIVEEKGNVNKENYVEVDLIDLVAFLEELNSNVKVLKLDIEGAEIEVLNHLIDRQAHQSIGKILVETHETKIVSQKEPLNQLKERITSAGIKNINLNWL